MSRGRKEAKLCIIDQNPHLAENKEEFVEKHKRLVHGAIKRYFGSSAYTEHKSFNYDDLAQFGFIGLLKAYHNFDPTKYDVKISTYAVPMIVGEIQRFLRDNDTIVRISRVLKQSYHRINKIIREEALNVSVKEYVFERSDQELFDDKRIDFPSMNMIKEFRGYIDSNVRNTPASFDMPVFSGDGDAEITLGETLAFSYHDDPSELIIREFRATALTERENLIYTLLVDKERTQSEAGKELGLSQVQVSRLFKQIGMKYLRYRKEAGLLHTAEIPEKYAKEFEEKEVLMRLREQQAERIRKEKEEKERQKMKEKQLKAEAKRLLKKGHNQVQVCEMTGLSRNIVGCISRDLRKSGDLPTSSKNEKATSKSVKHVKAGKSKPVAPKEISDITRIVKGAESTITPLDKEIPLKGDKYEDKLDNSITPIKTPKPAPKPVSAEKKMNVESNGLKDEPFLRPDTPELKEEEAEVKCRCQELASENKCVENPDAWKPEPSEAVVTLKVEGSEISLHQLQYELGKALESAFASGKEKVSNYKLQLKLK